MNAPARCCPHCPLYLRDSPGLHARGAQTAGCSFGGLRVAHICRQPLSSGVSLVHVSMPQRLSVLLPERSDRCNQPSCAFGGLHGEGSLLTRMNSKPAAVQ